MSAFSFDCGTRTTPRAVEYAALLRKLESSCKTCGVPNSRASPRLRAVSTSSFTSPPPAERNALCHKRLYGVDHRQTPEQSAPSPLEPHDPTTSWWLSSSLPTADSICSLSGASSLGSHAQCGNGIVGGTAQQGRCSPAAPTNMSKSASAAAAVSDLFEVRVRKRRHCQPEVHATRQLSLLFQQVACRNDALTPSALRSGPLDRGTFTSPTADDYYRHYLTRYRHRCPSGSLPASESALAPGSDTRGVPPHLLDSVQCRKPQAEHSDYHCTPPQLAVTTLQQEYPPCLSTPACSPILAVRHVGDEGRAKEASSSPDIVCRLFTSAFSDNEEEC